MGAQGTTILDFGAFPGASDAAIAVTGQNGILSGSLVEAWLFPLDTINHSADEHRVETIKLSVGNIIAGVGFTIYGINDNQLSEPIETIPIPTQMITTTSATAVTIKTTQFAKKSYGGGKGTLLYGTWKIGWVYN